jgi:WD40 domain-containing protein
LASQAVHAAFTRSRVSTTFASAECGSRSQCSTKSALSHFPPNFVISIRSLPDLYRAQSQPDWLRGQKKAGMPNLCLIDTPASFGNRLPLIRGKLVAWMCPLPRNSRHSNVWNIITNSSFNRRLKGHTFWVTAVALSSDGRRAVSGSWDNTLRVWELKDGKELVTLTIDGHVTACALAHDNRTIVAGDSFGRVHFLRLIEADEVEPPIRERSTT